MVSAEVEALARTGGLGDAVVGLAHELARIGCEVLVVTPLYGVTRSHAPLSSWSDHVHVPVGAAWFDAGVLELPEVTHEGAGSVRTCLLDIPQLFAREGIYGDSGGAFGDNDVRFAALSRGALEVAVSVFGDPATGQGPDVIHAHDWHAALAIVYARSAMGESWAKKITVYTIHNLAHQGVLGLDAAARLGVPHHLVTPEIAVHEGQLNVLKAATTLAHRVTTVSPGYAREILTPEGGFGLDGHLRAHAPKIIGILNGIDADRFDPSIDPDVAHNYDFASFLPGRRACKERLLDELSLGAQGTRGGALFGLVARLSWQKGIDLFLPIVSSLVDRGANVVLLGAGEPALEAAVREVGARHPGRVSVHIAFDEGLAKRIYSAVDFFLVPSRFEPCGLTQLYAMRYGALPIVTPTGGLQDSVEPTSDANGRGTGLVASETSTVGLLVACDDALVLYGDRDAYARAVERAMARDSSWLASAKEYEALYRSLV